MQVFFNELQAIRQRVADKLTPYERGQVEKRQTRYDYRHGPMKFLGQQIVRHMEDAGYPAKIFCLYRSPHEQNRVFTLGNSKAQAFQSPHQFYEAVDIVHPSKYWDVSADYWDALRDCAQIVEQRFNVEFELGYDWGWDMAHIELKDWRKVRDRTPRDVWRAGILSEEDRKKGGRVDAQPYLDARFKEVLPKVWAEFVRRPKNRGLFS